MRTITIDSRSNQKSRWGSASGIRPVISRNRAMPSWIRAMTGARNRRFIRPTTTMKAVIATSTASSAWPGTMPPGKPKKTASPFPKVTTVAIEATAMAALAPRTIGLRMDGRVTTRRTAPTTSGKAIRKAIHALMCQCAPGRRWSTS